MTDKPRVAPPADVEELAKAIWGFEGGNKPTWEECIARDATCVEQNRELSAFVLDWIRRPPTIIAAGVAAVSPSEPPTCANCFNPATDHHCYQTFDGTYKPAASAVTPEPTPVGAPFGYWEGTRIPRSCPAAESRRADSRVPAEADHIANSGKMMPAEVLEVLKRDVLAELHRIRQEWWKSSVAENLLEDAEPRIAAIFDAAVKEPTK